jgi:hypothetical protein
MWVGVPLGRLGLRFHLLLPVAVGVFYLLPGDLWLRYLVLLLTLLVHELAHALAALGLGRGRAVVSMWPFFGRADGARQPPAPPARRRWSRVGRLAQPRVDSLHAPLS